MHKVIILTIGYSNWENGNHVGRFTRAGCTGMLVQRARAAPLRSATKKRTTSANMPLLRLQSSEGKFTMSREIERTRRPFCRHGSSMFTEVARLVPSGNLTFWVKSQDFQHKLHNTCMSRTMCSSVKSHPPVSEFHKVVGSLAAGLRAPQPRHLSALGPPQKVD